MLFDKRRPSLKDKQMKVAGFTLKKPKAPKVEVPKVKVPKKPLPGRAGGKTVKVKTK